MGKMLITHNNKTEIVTNLKDCYSLAEKDGNAELVETVEYFINNGEDGSLKDRFSLLEDEFRCYEMSLASREVCLRDIKADIESLLNKIDNAKRLNRNEIIDYLESIKNTIENEF